MKRRESEYQAKKFVMVIDLAKCDGCGKCTEACNKMHYLPKTKEWIEVLEMQDSPKVAPYYMPKNCFHPCRLSIKPFSKMDDPCIWL